MILEFLMFITHRFLTIMKKFDSQRIVLRTFNIVSLMVANVLMFFYGLIYVLLVSSEVISNNMPLVIATVFLLWLIVFIGVRRKYKNVFRKAMKEAVNKYRFSDRKITVVFFGCFLGSFIIIGCGIIFLRLYIYG
ncbi:hypothetical protein DBR40_03580 [Pedobacter sp. KBW01]|nr:hypothetical protein DBR40_03580 [Pedobacter sp. KBW01]